MNQNNQSRLSRFIAELRRRHVVRVALGYAAVLFVILQLSEIILPAFLRNPQADQVLRVLVVGGVLLFPIVLAMAWIYEITPQGIRSMADLDAEAGIPEQGAIFHRLAFLAVTILAAGAAGLWWWQSADPIQTNPGFQRPSSFQAATTLDASGAIRSLAVLPLEDQSAREGDEYFAASMHEALVSQISQNSALRVISRTTVLRYDQTGKSLAQMGAELGVDAIVEGSVLLVDGSVRVTVQLIHAASDTHLWAQDYTRDLTDIIALQRDVATAIAGEIGMQVLNREPGMGDRVATNVEDPAIGAPELDDPVEEEAAGPATGTATRTATPPTPAPAAPSAPDDVQLSTMRGRYMLQGRSSEELSAAEDYFTEALSRDPDFAPALTGLAGAHLFQGLGREGESERLNDLMQARDNAQRALLVDPENQEALEIVFSVDDALSEFAVRMGDVGAAIASSVASAGGMQIRSLDSLGIVTFDGDTVLFQTGGSRLVSTELGRLVQERMGMTVMEDGRDVGGEAHMRDQWTAAVRLASAGRLEQATEVLVQASTAGQADWKMWELREQLQRAQGDFEAVVATRRARRDQLGREPGPSINSLTRDVEPGGLQAYWRWKQAEYQARVADGLPVLHTYRAAAAAGLGQSDAAITSLRQAISERESVLAALRVDPVWDNLRSDARFQNLLSEIRVRAQRDGRGPDGPSR